MISMPSHLMNSLCAFAGPSSPMTSATSSSTSSAQSYAPPPPSPPAYNVWPRTTAPPPPPPPLPHSYDFYPPPRSSPSSASASSAYPEQPPEYHHHPPQQQPSYSSAAMPPPQPQASLFTNFSDRLRGLFGARSSTASAFPFPSSHPSAGGGGAGPRPGAAPDALGSMGTPGRPMHVTVSRSKWEALLSVLMTGVILAYVYTLYQTVSKTSMCDVLRCCFDGLGWGWV
jgi:hypothetical protein